jgi:RNA polymerase primary sigma factor
MTAKKTAAEPKKVAAQAKTGAKDSVKKAAAPAAPANKSAAKVPAKATTKTAPAPAVKSGKAAAKGKPPAKTAEAAKGRTAKAIEDEEVEGDADVVEVEIEVEVEAEVEVVEGQGQAAAHEGQPRQGARADARVRARRDHADRRGSRQAPQELKTLIKMGKTRGFLTHQEINDHLPEKLVDERNPRGHRLDAQRHGHRGLRAGARRGHAADRGGNTTTATEEEAEEAAEAALSTVDSEFGRTTDPVRMYMREMGTVELLTREGEIEIAKRIEGGLQAMMLAISASPTTIAEILAMADKIAAGEMQISEVVDGFVSDDEADDYVAEEDFDEFDEERRRRRQRRLQGADQEARGAEEPGAGQVRRAARPLREDAQGLREGRLQVRGLQQGAARISDS